MATEPNPDLIDEVRTAYADAGQQRNDPAYVEEMRCLAFLTSDWLTPAAAASVVEYIGPYNRFDPDTVGSMLDAITEAYSDALVAVGREGSPVLYVETDAPETVMRVLGPTSYEEAESPMFPEGRPDELGRVEPGAVGNRRQEMYGDGEDQIPPHQPCSHAAPPVPVADFAEPDPDRAHIRAWWD